MNYKQRRQEIFKQMEMDSIFILFSGIEIHVSADEYAPFEANRNFFYLTGLRRENMALVMHKTPHKEQETLFIEKADPLTERWNGRKVTPEEAKGQTEIEDIRMIDEIDSSLSRIMSYYDISCAYFDTYRHQTGDLADYNPVKAKEFAANYPGVRIRNSFPMLAKMRMQKDSDEIALIRKAVELTDQGLKYVMRNLKPGMKEYQAQADFEYSIRRNGAEKTAFSTIAGSGINGTMLHYETNQDTCEDNTLLLLDLGAKYRGYCADITRTYPVNGTYTKRQREVYDIVLAANRKVAAEAKPGMTLAELNRICEKVLAEGCIRLGLIQTESEIRKYYMHGVSHHLGIDVHDVTDASCSKLCPGAVITDEPGLYIDEWEIGIRIEDDLLITEDGCEVLSEAVPRTAEEIEAFMSVK